MNPPPKLPISPHPPPRVPRKMGNPHLFSLFYGKRVDTPRAPCVLSPVAAKGGLKVTPENQNMKTVNHIAAAVPTYALSYIVNGDASGLGEGETETIDTWLAECRENLLASHPGATIDLVTRDGVEGSFTSSPAFGLACDCIPGAVVAMVDNADPAPPLELPWHGSLVI